MSDTNTAAPMRLRAEPPRVTRLSRKVLAGVGAAALLGVGGALIYALQTREAGPEEANSTQPRTVPLRMASPVSRAIILARSWGRHCRATLAGQSSMHKIGDSRSFRLPSQPLPSIPRSNAASRKKKPHG